MSKRKNVCPTCKGKLLDIVYGLPSPELFDKAEKHEVYLGGCCISDNDPKYFCPKCHIEYYEDMTPVKDEDDFECATYCEEISGNSIKGE